MKLKAIFPKRRDGGYGSVTLIINGKRVAHAIGGDGIVTVPDEYVPGLIATGNFAVNDGHPSPAANGSADEAGSGMELNNKPQMLITNGEDVTDLMLLDKKALLVLSKEMGLEFTNRNSTQTLRDGIYAHVNQ